MKAKSTLRNAASVPKNSRTQKPPRREVFLEFLDALFDAGAPVVVAPDDLGRIGAFGSKDAKGVAGHVEQEATDSGLVVPHPLAHHDEAARLRPPLQLYGYLPDRVIFIDLGPGADRQ